ncbi:MAG: hypothetical protein ACKO96_34545, partial [Flammeovirgaceae bacterium]
MSNLTLSTANFKVENPGVFRFSNELDNLSVLSLGENDLSNASIKLDSERGGWSIIGNPSIGEIELEKGSLAFTGGKLSVKKITSKSTSGQLDIAGSVITDIQKFDLLQEVPNFLSNEAVLKTSLTDMSSFNFGSHNYQGKLE